MIGSLRQGSATFNNLMLEMRERNIHSLSLFDIVLDFTILDAFNDLEVSVPDRAGTSTPSNAMPLLTRPPQEPPSSVRSVLSNKWLPVMVKEKGITMAVHSVMKSRGRKSRLGGYFSRYYTVMDHVSPVLAAGILGCGSPALNALCTEIKDQFMGLVRDIFSDSLEHYETVDMLASATMRAARTRLGHVLPPQKTPPALTVTTSDS
jgi:hypothetical protein